MRVVRPLALLAFLGVLSAGCSDSTDPGDDNGGGGGPPVVSKLTCEDPDSGNRIECSLVLEEVSSFEITLRSSNCTASGNQVRLTSPVPTVLTNDGCHAETGQTWTFPVTWPAGTEIKMEVVSARFPNPAALDVTGAYPHWVLYFEDGYDDDLDDLVLDVRATK